MHMADAQTYLHADEDAFIPSSAMLREHYYRNDTFFESNENENDNDNNDSNK